MSVRQAITTTAGKFKLYDTPARLVFYNIPGQEPYWKFEFAALFQIWSIDPAESRRAASQGAEGELLLPRPRTHRPRTSQPA